MMSTPQRPKPLDKSNELVRVAVPASTLTTVGLVQPTQVRRPWRAAVRTIFQIVLALATLLPFIVTGVYGNTGDYPAIIAQLLAVAAGVSRVMALPQVETFLRTFAPFLAAAPKLASDRTV